MINFQDPLLKGDFDNYSARKVCLLPEKLVGNQYLDIA